MGSIKAFTPLALMEHLLITGNSTVQRFHLRSKRMWRIGIRQAGLSLWHCGLMDALWLKEKGLPLPPYAQSFTPLQLALISSPYLRSLAGNWIGNSRKQRSIISCSGGIYFFFHLPLSPHLYKFKAFQQTAEELMGIAVTVRTHLNDCADFASSNNAVLQSERLRSPLRF